MKSVFIKCQHVMVLLILILWPSLSYSLEYGENLTSTDLDERARNLYTIIRCPTCNGQSIEASQSETAYDLREFVRNQLKQGHSDAEIIAELRRQYGESITFQPSLNYQTAILWGLPFLMLLLGCGYLLNCTRKQ